MPQLFQVLRCYKCLVFQVHQTKKSNKWECKMCGEKQSIKRHYGLGNAKECRLHVQKLNGIRGEMNELKDDNLDSDDEYECNASEPIEESQVKSKWSSFIDEPNHTQPHDNKSMFLDNAEVVLELPQRRKPVFGNKFKSKVTKPVTLKESDSNETEITEIKREKQAPCITKMSFNDQFKPNFSEESFNPLTNKNLNTMKHVTTAKRFKPPKIDKNSKWAKFTMGQPEDSGEELVDMSEGLDQFGIKLNENENLHDDSSSPFTEVLQDKIIVGKKSDTLFALCDDGDLDNVLDL